MPIYEFKCLDCQHIEEEIVSYKVKGLICPICGGMSERLFPTRPGPVNFGWPDSGITMEHAGPKPVHFENRQQAKEFEKKNKVKLGCL